MIRFFVTSVVLVALVLPLMTGCDNPACALAGNCGGGSGGSGGFGSAAASIPVDGEELTAAAPTIVKFAPTGTSADTKSPIVLTFSESMASTNLASAFELTALAQDGVTVGAVPLPVGVVIGDGHMVVLFPAALQGADGLLPGTDYTIRYREGVVFADRTGQPAAVPANGTIGTFSTAAAAPGFPLVLATWPEHLSTNESPIGEIDVVFSRPMNATTVVDATWVVTVGGIAPANDPAPQPLSISPVPGAPTETRAFRWRSAASLGLNADVKLELSPTGNVIKDAGGVTLVNKIITYKTLPFAAPTGGAITLGPVDAIGIDQLSGPMNFAVRVDTPGGAPGDQVGVYIFGREPQPTPPIDVANLKTIALLREEPIVAPFTSFTFSAAELDLARQQSPLKSRFTDGPVTFAFYLKRGGITSTIKLLDVDSERSGVQSPIQDLVAPVILGLSTSGSTVSTFRSDQRDIVIVGRASEELRSVSVDSSIGDNEVTLGVVPPVTGSDEDGLFIAAPVKVGVLTPAQSPASYTIVGYDSALNSTGAITGQFTQVGAAANGVALFTDVNVEVFDAATLAPVASATVYVHEDMGGVVSSIASGTTLADGRVTLPASLLGSTIVTVDARSLGYDVVTFDGVPTDSVSIPLRRTLQGAANLSGSIITTGPSTTSTKSVADTRFPVPGETLLTAGSCTTQTLITTCVFGPTAIRSREIGAVSSLVTIAPSSLGTFMAFTFLQGYELVLPVKPADPGQTSTMTLPTGNLLESAASDPEELPIEVTPIVLTTAAYPAASGDPRVRVEATSPGIGYGVTVGSGIAFDDGQPANQFVVRAAIPGSCDGVQDVPADPLGRFVTAGTIDADLLLRVEAVDMAGNRGGVRPRLSTLSVPIPFAAPAPPTPEAVPFTNNSGGVAVDFTFTDTMLDTAGQFGIHKVVFTDAAGTTWTVWHMDELDAAGPLTALHLPKVGTVPTLPLAAGVWTIRVSSFGIPTSASLTNQNFLWSDVEREFARFAHAVPTSATPPP